MIKYNLIYIYLFIIFIILFILYEYLIYHIVSKKIHFHKNFENIYLEKYHNTHLHINKVKNNLIIKIINNLQNILDINKLYFIGSIIRNDFIEDISDIDILYFTDNNNDNNDNNLLLIKKYLYKIKNKYNLDNLTLIKENFVRKYCNILIHGNLFTIQYNKNKIQLCSYNIKYKYIILNYYYILQYSITQSQINIIYFLKLLKDKIISHYYYKKIKKNILNIGYYDYYFEIYEKKLFKI